MVPRMHRAVGCSVQVGLNAGEMAGVRGGIPRAAPSVACGSGLAVRCSRSLAGRQSVRSLRFTCRTALVADNRGELITVIRDDYVSKLMAYFLSPPWILNLGITHDSDTGHPIDSLAELSASAILGRFCRQHRTPDEHATGNGRCSPVGIRFGLTPWTPLSRSHPIGIGQPGKRSA